MLHPDSSTPEPAPESASAEAATACRNLVICCDGTSNEFGRKNTNVVRLLQCLERDTARQVAYYDPGVGTLPEPNRVTRLGKLWSKVAGLAFGAGLTKDVMEAYAYLMDHWEEGDRVYIFGFSRGAYTARVLAGLLHTFGLLPRGSHNLLPYVIKNYRAFSERDGDNSRMSEKEEMYREFRRTFARSVKGGDTVERHFPVHFLGLWDTVASVGWVWQPKSFRHTAFNPSVRMARHAIALDERRFFFRQNRFAPIWGDGGKSVGSVDGVPKLVECWFPGVHCDIGGGYAGEEDQLWPLAFRWILEEAEKAGLLTDGARKSALLKEDEHLATKKHHESLDGPWKLAEYFPALRRREDRETKEWKGRFEIGRGTPRKVRDGELLHPSVLSRLREKAVVLPDGRKGLYAPRSLCRAFQEKVRSMTEIPTGFYPYQSEDCGCEACERLAKEMPR